MTETPKRSRTSNKRGARKGLRRSKTIALKKLTPEEFHVLRQAGTAVPREHVAQLNSQLNSIAK